VLAVDVFRLLFLPREAAFPSVAGRAFERVPADFRGAAVDERVGLAVDGHVEHEVVELVGVAVAGVDAAGRFRAVLADTVEVRVDGCAVERGSDHLALVLDFEVVVRPAVARRLKRVAVLTINVPGLFRLDQVVVAHRLAVAVESVVAVGGVERPNRTRKQESVSVATLDRPLDRPSAVVLGDRVLVGLGGGETVPADSLNVRVRRKRVFHWTADRGHNLKFVSRFLRNGLRGQQRGAQQPDACRLQHATTVEPRAPTGSRIVLFAGRAFVTFCHHRVCSSYFESGFYQHGTAAIFSLPDTQRYLPRSDGTDDVLPTIHHPIRDRIEREMLARHAWKAGATFGYESLVQR